MWIYASTAGKTLLNYLTDISDRKCLQFDLLPYSNVSLSKLAQMKRLSNGLKHRHHFCLSYALHSVPTSIELSMKNVQ